MSASKLGDKNNSSRRRQSAFPALWRIAAPVAAAVASGALLANIRPALAATVTVTGTPGTAGTNGNSADPPTNGTVGGSGQGATATTTTPIDPTGNTATASGGAGGDGGIGGDATAGNTNGGNGANAGNGGNGSATATTALASGQSSANATATGGQNSGTYGGTPGTPSGTGSYGSAGSGGNGGNASSSASATTGSADDATATARASGGAGGNPGYYTVAGQVSGVDGNGGNATQATAYANSNGGDASATATSVGGGAGESEGIGAVAGTGGTASGATAQAISTGGGSAGASVTEVGGNGGQASNGANAGNGQNQSLTNAVSGSSTSGLELSQSSNGGAGGEAFDVNFGASNGGNGGNASNSLTYTDSAAIFLQGLIDSSGGAGGSVNYTDGTMGNGGTGGNATGTLSLTGANQISAQLSIDGGRGGAGGSVGGTGGVASGIGYGQSNGSQPVYVSVDLTSGNGGNGYTQAGNGGNCTATNALSGSTANSLTLDQIAIAGSAGSSLADGGKVGAAGNAVSMLTATNPDGGSIEGETYAGGGMGGSAYSGDNANGGNGGTATSYTNVSSSSNTATAIAESFGGYYGSGAGTGVNGQYGAANATAVATSPVSAYANTEIAGGSGTGASSANTSGSVIASLSAITSAPTLNHAIVQATSEAEVDQSAYSAITGYNAFAAANGMPFASDVANATSSTTNVKAAFAQGNTFNMGLMILSAQSLPSATSSTQTFTSQTNWTLTPAGLPSATGNLMVGLFGASDGGTGTATFTITLNGSAVDTQSFPSLSAAAGYFTDTVLNYGAIDADQTGSTISLDFSLAMSSASANAYLDPEIIFATPLATAAKWTGLGTDDNWKTPANWVGNTAPVSPEPLTFSSTTQTTNNNNFTAGTVFNGITFDNTAGAFVLGGNSIDLGGDIVNDSPNVQTINLPLALQKSLNLSAVSSNIQINGPITGAFAITTAGANTVTLTGANSYSGGTNANAGAIVFGAAAALPTGSKISIGAAGKVSLASGIGPTTIGSLSIAAGGVLDITNNQVFIHYGAGPDPITSIAAWIASGYAGGAWDGAGIISTDAQSNSASYGIGYADSADPGNPANLSSGTIEIVYTLLGDANLDGKVNGADFTILAANFNQSGKSWDQGDFNYDGDVNGGDFTLLAKNFNQTAIQSAVASADLAALDAFAAANGISAANVPEPACAGLIALAAVGALQRRRRSSC